MYWDMIDYQGEDLIIATGAPGSRWSASLRVISFNPRINRSDEHDDFKYDQVDYDSDGNKIEGHGWHRGAYWGPNHKQGHTFDRLDLMSKEDIVYEFAKPYKNFAPGVKIIKSHWFAYHLPLLKEMFPRAKFIAMIQTNEFCFDWWHTVGGWDITYPHYDWYENDIRMRNQIKKENKHIRDFFEIDNYTIEQAFHKLGLPDEMPSDSELDEIDSKVASLTKQYAESYTEVLQMIMRRNRMGIR